MPARRYCDRAHLDCSSVRTFIPIGRKPANGDRHQWNIGDALHLVQIAILLISLGKAYEKFDANAQVTGKHTEQLDRIEHYLSSRDSKYWEDSRKDR